MYYGLLFFYLTNQTLLLNFVHNYFSLYITCHITNSADRFILCRSFMSKIQICREYSFKNMFLLRNNAYFEALKKCANWSAQTKST